MSGITASKLALGHVTSTFNSPISRTWALWSSFGAANLYISGCNAVKLFGFGVGSVRVLSMHGHEVEETLIYLNPVAHSYAYSIADSPGFPATGCLGLIQLHQLTKEKTRITWRGFADRVVPGTEESLKQQLDKLYCGSIEKARLALEE